MGKAVNKIIKVGSLGILDLEPPEMPGIPEAKVMPIADEQALAAARKRQAGRKGSGRASTVLTGGNLGSGTGRRKLGG